MEKPFVCKHCGRKAVGLVDGRCENTQACERRCPSILPKFELNALIHEHVFGIPRGWLFETYKGSGSLFYIPSGRPRRTHETDMKPLPDYDSVAGWWVAAKLAGPGGSFNFSLCLKDGSGICYAEFLSPSKPPQGAVDKSPSMAICIAALRALGVDPPTGSQTR